MLFDEPAERNGWFDLEGFSGERETIKEKVPGPDGSPWLPGERQIGDWGAGIPLTLLKRLSALNLPLERQHLWSDPVPMENLPQGHVGGCNGKGPRRLLRVELDLAPYGEVLQIIGVAYGYPGEGSGGWGGSCVSRSIMQNAVELVLLAKEAGSAKTFALFPEEV